MAKRRTVISRISLGGNLKSNIRRASKPVPLKRTNRFRQKGGGMPKQDAALDSSQSWKIKLALAEFRKKEEASKVRSFGS
jgi:hypothetical protein